MQKLLFAILSSILIVACVRQKEVNQYSDPDIVKIEELKDRRASDSLSQYLTAKSPLHRKQAVLAFASIQDTSYAFNIAKLLNDQDHNVRKAAAFALGQIQNGSVVTHLFSAIDNSSKAVQGEILESLGKLMILNDPTGNNPLKQYINVDDHSDSNLTEGKSWGLYRIALNSASRHIGSKKEKAFENSVLDSTLVGAISPFLNANHTARTRLGAAQALSRITSDLSPYKNNLLQYVNDKDPEVRMAIVLALRKINDPVVLPLLDSIIMRDKDYRAKINAIRSLQHLNIGNTKEILLRSLHDANINVGIASSEIIKTKITSQYAGDFLKAARGNNNWRIKANIYDAVLSITKDVSIHNEVKALYNKTSNPYAKAAYLTALQQSPHNIDFIQQQLFAIDTPVIKSSAAAALVSINYHKDFNDSLKTKLAAIYQKGFAQGDPAVIGTFAAAIADSTLGYKSVYDDTTFLYDAKRKLTLPKDNESLQSLELAIAHLENRKNNPVKNEYNNPIDWALVKTIPTGQRAVIKTSKGDITIKLLVDEAPGSVANFVRLTRMNYFDNKFFHRVVPNFVVQAGCNRGDGWGSEDYSLRSEFSTIKYKTGSVGMASAGKDTEGTQWFITHSPTPHLDGRYTIFAEVVEGMEVVHVIEVGDQIIEVALSDEFSKE